MKRRLWGSFLVFLLAACSSSPADLPQATNAFSFAVDPAAQTVNFSSAPAALSTQAEDGSRVLVPGTDLSLESYTFVFLPGNVLAIDAVFKNVSGQTFTNLSFSRGAGSSNVVNSTEPDVVATLAPGASTGTLRFEVQHRGQSFSYEVEATATVETGGADCADPVTIPDEVLRQAVRDALNKPEGDITCADMASLTELRQRGRQGENGLPNRFVENLEGLQYAVNLTTLQLMGNLTLKDISPLSTLTKLVDLDLSGNRIGDIGPLSTLVNLTRLDLGFNLNIEDVGPLSGLTGLETLVLNINRIADLTPLRNLTNLRRLDLGTNFVADLSPLVTNTGVGNDDDRIDLRFNCLDVSPGSQTLEDVAALESRNPDVQNVFLGTQRESDEDCGRLPPPPTAEADLLIEASPGRGDDTVLVGDDVRFFVAVQNKGPDTASGVTVTAEVTNAAGLELFESAANATCEAATNTSGTYELVCTLTADLPSDPRDSGFTRSIAFRAESAQAGPLTARFEVQPDAETFDPDLANNGVSVEVGVLPENPSECVDPVSIPDDVLARAIREELQKSDGDLSCADLAGLTELTVDELDDVISEVFKIQSLEGLQFAGNLEALTFSISGGPDADILVPLKGLTSLQSLNIRNSREFGDEDLGNIDLEPLSGLVNLTDLSLPPTQFGDLSALADLVNLTELSAPDGNVTDFSPLSSLTKLTTLDLSYSGSEPSERVTDLAFLEGLTELEALYLNNNLITDLGPLVANGGVGNGDDIVDLSFNCLDTAPGTQTAEDIATIEARNPDVTNLIGVESQSGSDRCEP